MQSILYYKYMNNIGTLIRNNTKFNGNEEETVSFLLRHGFDIELMRPTNTKKNKNADI